MSLKSKPESFPRVKPQLVLTSKSAANMSSDSVNMSGADGFFGLAPEHTTKRWGVCVCECLLLRCVVKHNIWNICWGHILCRAQNMLQGAETARLWITSQPLNEHMTERQKIKKNPASHKSDLPWGCPQICIAGSGVSEHTDFSGGSELSKEPKIFHHLFPGVLLMMEFIQLALYAS